MNVQESWKESMMKWEMPMYRIVGCILVVAAGAGMGFSGSMRLSEQIRILENCFRW